ncbi:hypothetical protein QZM19_23550 [Burkholderia multivorans]|uniref:hypothetical protein n=1 Tax=Burkholderia multivorans TaxID=87883 RepID=UPI001C212FEE|nr:hypothetical protein [Burkholderia multivorans]MBU9608755.1 hypothetical protein [Burkholderia multivorans]MBU9623460.1 hypothetical protein [Burkholderia multivorans]MDN7866357.1 hypothetical protein [Burkholderia multivorans]
MQPDNDGGARQDLVLSRQGRDKPNADKEERGATAPCRELSLIIKRFRSLCVSGISILKNGELRRNDAIRIR